MDPISEQNDFKKAKRKKTLIAAIAGIAAVIAANTVFKMSPNIDKVLSETASNINKNCPIMVDKATRFDNSIAMPDKVFQYNYTLVETENGTADTVKLKNYITPLLLNNIKTSPDMKFFRENKVTLAYYYKSKSGEYLCKVLLKPEQYE